MLLDSGTCPRPRRDWAHRLPLSDQLCLTRPGLPVAEAAVATEAARDLPITLMAMLDGHAGSGALQGGTA